MDAADVSEKNETFEPGTGDPATDYFERILAVSTQAAEKTSAAFHLRPVERSWGVHWK